MIRNRTSLVWLTMVMLSAWGCSKQSVKAPDDPAITDSIKARFFSEPKLKTEPIDIAVHNGEVTLTGEVSSEEIRGLAANLVGAIPGVTKVYDRMDIKPLDAAQLETPPTPLQPEVQQPGAPPQAAKIPKPKTPGPPQVSQTPVAPETKPVGESKPVPVEPPPPPPPQPRQVTIPAGTEIQIRMIDAVNSDESQVGSSFAAALSAPIVIDDEVVVPKGAGVSVALASAKSSGKFKGSSELVLALQSLECQGVRYPLKSTTYEQSGESRGKQTAKRVGIGAAVGTAIGAIAGGGKGAAIGAGVGAGSGVLVQAVTKGKQVQVPSETKLDFRLEEPVQLTLAPAANKK